MGCMVITKERGWRMPSDWRE